MGHNEAISLSNFSIVLKNLIVNVSKLDTASSSALITAVLHYKWLDIPPASRKKPDFMVFLEFYAQFLGVLVSSFPKYLHEVIKKLIKEFPDIADDTYPHHTILRKIINFTPTCISSIPPVLAKNLPHHLSASTNEITNYMRNAMKVISYCPDLQFSIWQLVVECCIKLDVELQNELDNLDDDSIEELINGDANEYEDDEDGEVYTVTSTKNIKKMVSKLDSALELLLQMTSSSFTREEIENGNGVTLFNTLTSLFRSHILPTHFTKSIQFLLFHISQYQPELADAYLVLLIDVAFNPNETTEKRLKALQYLTLRERKISQSIRLFSSQVISLDGSTSISPNVNMRFLILTTKTHLEVWNALSCFMQHFKHCSTSFVSDINI